MAREEAGFVWQRKDLSPDGFHELVEVSPRQIGSPDGPHEHHIADEDLALLLAIEDDMARSMARSVPDLESALAEGEFFPIPQGFAWRGK